MTISIACPDCSTKYQVPEAHAGKRTRCKNCESLIHIPDLEEPVEGEPSDERPARRSTREGASKRRGRATEPVEDALPPLAVVASAAAAVAGAVGWFLVLWKLDVEIGWLAVGVGALAGLGMVKLGGRGMVAAVVAAVLGGIGVVGGHVAGVNHIYNKSIEQAVYSTEYQEDYKEIRGYGREVAKMDHPLTVATVTEYAKEFGIDEPMSPSDIAEFKAQMEDWEMLAGKGGPGIYQDRARAAIRGDVTLIDVLKDGFEPIDLLFLALGISAAFSLVMKQD